MCLVGGNICCALTEIEFELISDSSRCRQKRVGLRRKAVETTAERFPNAAGNFKRMIERFGRSDLSLCYQSSYDSIDKQRIPVSDRAKFCDQQIVRGSTRSELD